MPKDFRAESYNLFPSYWALSLLSTCETGVARHCSASQYSQHCTQIPQLVFLSPSIPKYNKLVFPGRTKHVVTFVLKSIFHSFHPSVLNASAECASLPGTRQLNGKRSVTNKQGFIANPVTWWCGVNKNAQMYLHCGCCSGKFDNILCERYSVLYEVLLPVWAQDFSTA